jgi:hypothetical protein
VSRILRGSRRRRGRRLKRHPRSTVGLRPAFRGPRSVPPAVCHLRSAGRIRPSTW